MPFFNNTLVSQISFWPRSVKIPEKKNLDKQNETQVKNKAMEVFNYQYNRNSIKEANANNCVSQNSNLKIEKVIDDQNPNREKSDCPCDNLTTKQPENEEQKQLYNSGTVALLEQPCCKNKNVNRKGIFRTAIVNWMPGQDCEERARILKVRSRSRSKCGYNFQYRISPYPLCPIPDSIKPEGMWPSLDVDTLMLKVGINKNLFNDPCKKPNLSDGAGRGDKCKKEETKKEEVCKTILGPPSPKKKGPCFPPGGRLPKRRRLAKILIPALLLLILGLVIFCNCDEDDCIEDEEDDVKGTK